MVVIKARFRGGENVLIVRHDLDTFIHAGSLAEIQVEDPSNGKVFTVPKRTLSLFSLEVEHKG